jgi:hypothetical protein
MRQYSSVEVSGTDEGGSIALFWNAHFVGRNAYGSDEMHFEVLLFANFLRFAG